MSTDEPVTVLRDGKLMAAGLRRGEVVAYDWGFHRNGIDYVQRTFVLLDEHIQINQPVVFPAEQHGWWYCDLVSLRWDEVHTGLLKIDDMWIDVVIGPPDHPYRLLDLHDYAAALADGRISALEAAGGLTRMQTFLDRRLNRRHEVTRTWPDFPPAEIEGLLTADLPHDWRLLD